MVKSQIPIGERIQLSNFRDTNRRNYIKYMGLMAAGSISFSNFLTKVAGAEPEGKPITLVRHFDGEPKEIKVISPERYERLKEFHDLDHGRLKREYDGLLSIQFRTEGDKRYPNVIFNIDEDEDDPNTENGLEDEVNELSPVFKYRKPREGQELSYIRGGSDITDTTGPGGTAGTCTLLVNSVSSSSYGDLLITHEHEISSNATIYEPGGPAIADVVEQSVDFDSTAAEIKDNVDPNLYETVSSLENPDAAWTATGLSNELDTGTIDAEYHGATTGHNKYEAVEYHGIKEGKYHQVETATNKGESGDSGSPLMEENEENLVGLLWWGGGTYDLATAGYSALVAVDGAISPH